MCHTFGHDFPVHHKHMATALQHGRSLKSHIPLFTVSKFSFLHLFVCMHDCVSLSPLRPRSAKSLGHNRASRTRSVAVCAKLTHLLARACLCACAYFNISTLQYIWLHPTCHHTRQEMILLKVPEQIVMALIMSESIKPKRNHRLPVKMAKKKSFFSCNKGKHNR